MILQPFADHKNQRFAKFVRNWLKLCGNSFMMSLFTL
jgi:hypothetical protein